MDTFTLELVERAFKATSLVPFNPNQILDRFTKLEQEEEVVATIASTKD